MNPQSVAALVAAALATSGCDLDVLAGKPSAAQLWHEANAEAPEPAPEAEAPAVLTLLDVEPEPAPEPICSRGENGVLTCS